MNWNDCKTFWPNANLSRFVTIGAHQWHVQEAGSGRCVLLLHGAGASTHSWRDVLPDLARDHRVVAIDLPGQGFTRLDDLSRCGLEAMSDDIAQLLAEERIAPDMVVGHSAGAAIALRLSLGLDEPPESVVAINGALGNFHRPSSDILSQLTMMVARTPLPVVAFNWIASSHDMVRRLIARTGSTLDYRGVEYYRRLLSDRRHVSATVAMMTQWDVSPLVANLPRVPSRTLFLVGSGDLAVPPETSEGPARSIAGARIESFPGLGHLLHEERPAAASLAIRDWGRDPAGLEGSARRRAG